MKRPSLTRRSAATSQLRARLAPPVSLLTCVAFLFSLAPYRPARASVEEATPADTPNFSESTNGVHAGLETSALAATAKKARSAPVTATGSFTHALPIQVPPGRLGMTPSLGLAYDSASLAESPVGVGWSFGAPRIARSTRKGFPPVKGDASARTYDDDATTFTSPDGDLVPAIDGPAGATRVYAPQRETSPVRYQFVPDEQGGAFVEHVPSGRKRYYGRDPFTGQAARITNELGAHAWLLLRDEDPYGNAITYAYHHVEQQDRAEKTRAQTVPVLARVEWGGNRKASLPAPFFVQTVVEEHLGPVNLLDGNVVLRHRVRSIAVGIDGEVVWSYRLRYQPSTETGKALLASFEREGDVREMVSFRYTEGPPAGAERFVAMGAVAALEPLYTDTSRWFRTQSIFDRYRESPERAVQAPGFRGGVRFLDVDGNGTTDAIYHATGIGTTQTHVLWEESSLQAPSADGLGAWVLPSVPAPGLHTAQPQTGLPFFPLDGAWSRQDFPTSTLKELVDLDGDGDADGVALPLTVAVEPGRNVAAALPAAHVSPPLPGLGRLRVFTNAARSGGVAYDVEQLLPRWPAGAELRSRVIAEGRPDAEPGVFSPAGNLQYKVWPGSDVSMPVVDLNADGKPDVVVLKVRDAELRMHPGTPVAIPRTLMGQMRATADIPDAPDTVDVPISTTLRDLAGENAVVMLADDVVATDTSEPSRYVTYRTTAGALGLTQLPTTKPVVLLAGPGGVPRAPLPGAPPLPIGPSGPPVPPIVPEKPPWWMPQVDPEGCVWVPLDDWYRPDTGVAQTTYSLREYVFTPRAYLQRGEATRTFVAEGDSASSDFEASLRRALVGSEGSACAGDCLYPPHVNFNTFLADVNADGLPDLVTAEPASRWNDGAGVLTTCGEGHRVYLNRGYRFEAAPGETVAEHWSGHDLTQPLGMVANRDKRCQLVRPRTDDQSLRLGQRIPFPIAAMTQADVNGDGRADIILAYQPDRTMWSTPQQAVFVNTSRGYEPAPWITLPSDLALARNVLFSGEVLDASTGFPTWPRAGMADLARFVDLDGDGLTDIVAAGLCVNRPPLGDRTCTPTRWYRNVGEIPDRLVRVTSSSGSFTEVEYAPAKSSAVRTPAGGKAPPASLRVARTIRSAAGPVPTPAGFEPFPVLETRLSYENYVTDVLSGEAVGFEKVVAEFVNHVAGAPRDRVRVTRTYDVRPEIYQGNVGPYPVRHPLKGFLVSTLTEADGWIVTETNAAWVWRMGKGIRSRPFTSSLSERGPVGAEATFMSRNNDYDAFGNVVMLFEGNLSERGIVAGAQMRTIRTRYENRTDAAWQIGLPTQREIYGYSEDIAEQVTLGSQLSLVRASYTPEGAVATSTRSLITHADCPSLQDVTSYEYDATGLVAKVREEGRREMVVTYDARRLYPQRKAARVGRMIGQTFTPGATTLAVTFEHDLRTGAQTRVTDANGSTFRTTRDSLGRPRVKVGPTGAVLEETRYVDAFPPFAEARVYTDVGRFFDRRTELDGAGNVLAVVEGLGTAAVPFVRTSKVTLDAFGRTVEAFLPEQVAALDAGRAAASTGKTVTDYDGLDRPTRVVRPDGATTRYTYEPRAATEIDARGTPTRRVFDAFGELIAVHRNPGGPAGEASSHFLVRDGLGALVRVVDGDGFVRQIERDSGGRISALTLPKRPGTSAPSYTLCFDTDDKLQSVTSPGGRTTTVQRDELGRVVRSTSTDPRGNEVTTWQEYDDPSAAGGLGRLTGKTDPSGTYGFTYDELGLPKTLAFAPSDRAKGGATNVAARYTARFTYSPLGALQRVRIDGLPAAAEVRYERDDKGRPLAVDSFDGTTRRLLAADVAYDAQERMTGVRFGNGTSGEWRYGPLSQRLDEILYRNEARDVFASVAYAYDANGNPLEENRSKAGVSGFYTQKLQSFDALDRLRTAELFHPTGNRREAYAYSAGGNLLSAGDELYAYEAGVTPQAVSRVRGGAAGERRLVYDEDGYLSEETASRADGTSRTRTVRFDGNGCLAEVQQIERLAGGGEERSLSSFVCGLDGRVVGRKTTSANGTKTRIDFAGLAEIRPEEGVLLLRVPIKGATSVEEARSLATGARVPSASGYLHTDLRGSVLAVTDFDHASVLTHEAEYDAWGKTLASPWRWTPKHAFLNHEPIPDVGYYSFGARTYDPSLRRWLSPDPLLLASPDVDRADGAQLNLYGYASGNPAARIDRSGLQDSRVTRQLDKAAEGSATPEGAAKARETQKQVAIGGAIGVGIVAGPKLAALATLFSVAPGIAVGLMAVTAAFTVKSSDDAEGHMTVASVGAFGLGGGGAPAAEGAAGVRTGEAAAGAAANGTAAVAGAEAARSVGAMAANEPLLNWSWKSTPTWGHTFKTHGQAEATNLVGRAAGTGESQGLWVSNEAAAEFLSVQRPYIQGPASVELPPGLGQVIRPDGTVVQATHATLIPAPGGGYRTAFPIE